MEYGMPTLIEHENLEETAALCRELKLDFIELNMNLPQYQVDVLEQSEVLQKIADQYGIYYTIHLDENLNFCDFNKAVAQAYEDTVLRTIQVAKQLRVPVLNMHMNSGVYFTLPDRKVNLFEKYNKYYMAGIRNFRELCDKAVDGTNIKISIENTGGYNDYEKIAVEYLLESKAFTLTYDIGHSYTSGRVDEPFILKHRGQLKHFHIHDAAENKNHLTLGSGDVDIRKYIFLAEECGARCVIETKTIDALRQSVEWLRDTRNIKNLL